MEENKEHLKNELLQVIDEYNDLCQLPIVTITDLEWDRFLNVMEAHFLAHNNMDDYVPALNIIVRRAIYYAKITGANELSLNHVIKALSDLSVFNIYINEIKAMKEEITEKEKIYKKKLLK